MLALGTAAGSLLAAAFAIALSFASLVANVVWPSHMRKKAAKVSELSVRWELLRDTTGRGAHLSEHRLVLTNHGPRMAEELTVVAEPGVGQDPSVWLDICWDHLPIPVLHLAQEFHLPLVIRNGFVAALKVDLAWTDGSGSRSRTFHLARETLTA